MDLASPAPSGVVVIEPFSGAITPLTIAGFPANPALERPGAVFLESPQSILLGTRGPYLAGAGSLYRATFAGGAWTATMLAGGSTLGQLTDVVGPIVALPSGIYFSGTKSPHTQSGLTRILFQPAAGGPPQLFVDLARHGGSGLPGGLVALGTTLHLFTFDSSNSPTMPAEHWTIETAATPPIVTRVGALPRSLSTVGNVPPRTYNFAASQADYDPLSGNLIVLGGLGDVLWRTPGGTDVRQELVTDALPWGLQSMARNANTGSLAIGDRDAHYNELRCEDLFLADLLPLPPPATATTWLAHLAYVAAAAGYLPNGAGCPQSDGKVPCNYTNGLPHSGSAGFAMTLTNARANAPAFLLVGTSNTSFPPFSLPLSLGFLGAPQCSLRNSIEITVGTMTDSGGAASVPLPLPVGLRGDFFTQWAVADAAANALGLAFSDSRRAEVR